MKTVRIERQQFVDEVTRNRDEHRGVFELALSGYRSRVLDELERRLGDVRAGRRVDLSSGFRSRRTTPRTMTACSRWPA